MRARTAWLLTLTASALALGGCSAPPPTPTASPTPRAPAASGQAAGGAVKAAAASAAPATPASAGTPPGHTAPALWSKPLERQKQELERATRGTGVQVSRTDDNRLKLLFPSDIAFNSHSAVLQPQARSVLQRFAESLQRNPKAQVLIVGHADSSGGAHINDPLSKDRANATRRYIFSQKVMGPRIRTEGRGASEPIASNDTPAGRAQNRRIEIYVMEPR